METGNEPRGKTVPLLQMILIFVFALYLHWAFYILLSGAELGTGLFRYLISLELIIFFGHTVGFITWAFIFLFVGSHLLGGVFFIALLAPDRRDVARHPWLAFVVAVPMLLSTLTAYEIEGWFEQRDLTAPVNQVDLDMQKSAPALHDGFIELAGWEERRGAVDYSYVIYGKYHDQQVSIRYVPVVEKGWTPNSPIRYFVRATGVANDIPEPPAKGVETGELTGHLPFYISRQLRARHLKIDSSYSVIEWRQMDEHHHLVDNHTRYWVLFVGLLCTGPTAIGTSIFYFLARRNYLAQSR